VSQDLLKILDGEADQRAADAVAMHPDWPCRRGCDHCCRHLHAEPALTEAEWQRIEAVVGTEQVRQRLVDFAGPPYACPFLDDGACSIYDVRPVACRTYGFYVERGTGLYCAQIEQRDFAGVVWGNQVAVDRALDTLGPRIPLRVRFRVE